MTESEHIPRMAFYYQGIRRDSLGQLVALAASTNPNGASMQDVEAKALPFILRYVNYLLAVQRNHDARCFLEGSIGELCHVATSTPNNTKIQARERFETVIRLFELSHYLGANISFALQQLTRALPVEGLHAKARVDLAILSLSNGNSKEQMKCYKNAMKILEKETEQYNKHQTALPIHSILYNPDLRLALTALRTAKEHKLDDDASWIRIWYFRRSPRGPSQSGDTSLSKVVTALLDFCISSLKKEPVNLSSMQSHQDGTKLCLERSRLSAIFEYLWYQWCQSSCPLGDQQALYEYTLGTINACEVDVWLSVSALVLAQSLLRSNRRSATPDDDLFLTSALELKYSRMADYLFSLTLSHTLSGSFQDDDERTGLAEYLDIMAAHLHRPVESEKPQARMSMDPVAEVPEEHETRHTTPSHRPPAPASAPKPTPASQNSQPRHEDPTTTEEPTSFLEDPPFYEQSIHSSISDFRKISHHPHVSSSSSAAGGGQNRSSSSYYSIVSLSSSQRYLFGRRMSFGSLMSGRSSNRDALDAEGDVTMGD
ncbi:hypothetical protein UCRPC4_g00281 [Phaeomoniella chlamydospora]|uniref:Uncharacterized protein n=1 Tax=Phaeomoniella chlamydospora TaxID=158046 RepID=A0A0G2F2S0_PHACM|nr:hypothetical protein UCRPC4_g00281 [Phaeomoniella chlamydospora]